jgi:hypothetical protein
MNRERFLHLLDRHGGDLARWPAAEGAAAALLAQIDPEVRALLAADRRIETAWSLSRPAAPESALSARILAALPSGARERPPGAAAALRELLFELGGWRLAAPAFALALALGIAAGLALEPVPTFDLLDLAGFAELSSED